MFLNQFFVIVMDFICVPIRIGAMCECYIYIYVKQFRIRHVISIPLENCTQLHRPTVPLQEIAADPFGENPKIPLRFVLVNTWANCWQDNTKMRTVPTLVKMIHNYGRWLR